MGDVTPLQQLNILELVVDEISDNDNEGLDIHVDNYSSSADDIQSMRVANRIMKNQSANN